MQSRPESFHYSGPSVFAIKPKANVTLLTSDATIGSVGQGANIHCKGNVKFLADVADDVVIFCEGSPVFEGNVGAHCFIKTTGVPKFLKDIGYRTEIQCKEGALPVVNGFAERYKVNGNLYSRPTHIIYNEEEKKPAATESKEPESSGFFSSLTHTLAALFGSATATESKREKPAVVDAKTMLTTFSKNMHAYVDSFKRKPKNSDLVEKLKLTSDEEKELNEYYDPIFFTVPNVPVRLNSRVYDVKTLLTLSEKDGLRVDPFSKDEFFLRDVQPARDVQEKIENIIKRIQVEREAAATKLKIVSPKKAISPGGPNF